MLVLCRNPGLSGGAVAINGSKFKAMKARDKHFTTTRLKRRISSTWRCLRPWKPR